MPIVGTIVTTHYDQVAVVNASNSMTDAEGETIVNALNILLPTFCSDWNLKSVSAVFVPKGVLSTIPFKCIVLDNSDVGGNVVYNDETNGVAVAKVFAKTIIDNGGSVLRNPNPAIPTLSAAISHEIFELIADVNSNMWWNSASGATLYAAEVCDPVKSNVVNVSVSDTDGSFEEVFLSDWVLPAWTDPQAKIGPFNHNNTLTKPLTLDNGGYMILLQNGHIKYVFDKDASEYTKQNVCNRSQNRVEKHRSRCRRPGCDFVKHVNVSISAGTHCCYACRFGRGHGPHCKKEVV